MNVPLPETGPPTALESTEMETVTVLGAGFCPPPAGLSVWPPPPCCEEPPPELGFDGVDPFAEPPEFPLGPLDEDAVELDPAESDALDWPFEPLSPEVLDDRSPESSDEFSTGVASGATKAPPSSSASEAPPSELEPAWAAAAPLPMDIASGLSAK